MHRFPEVKHNTNRRSREGAGVQELGAGVVMGDILQVNWRYNPVARIGMEEGSQYKLRMARSRKGDQEGEPRSRRGDQKGRRRIKTGGKKMSKYRRNTANARERTRMGEINTAFEKLKEKIPLPSVGLGRQKCEKLTKINMLHIAINYIRTLEDILENGEEDVDICPEKLIKNPFLMQDEEEEKDNQSYSPLSLLKREDSSSPDSGIQENEDPECPDWTALSSTLDLSQVTGGGADSRGLQEPKIITLQNPPLLPGAFRLNFPPEIVTKSKPVVLTSRTSPVPPAPPAPPAPPLLLLQCKTSLLCSHFREEEDDLFSEISGNLDSSFTSLGGIDFSYDDPFKAF